MTTQFTWRGELARQVLAALERGERMAFHTDCGGLAFKCSDIKLQTNSTWGMRLSQLKKQKGKVRILTYSLPNMDYITEQLGRRPYDIQIIAHDKFQDRAIEIQKIYPGIRVRLCGHLHAKVLMIEPHTLIVSSANFGSSKWIEATMSVHSKEAHDYYREVFDRIWENDARAVNG